MYGLKVPLTQIPTIFSVVAMLAGVTSLPASVRAQSPKINFKLLYHVAQLANQAYEGKSEILGHLKAETAQSATPGTANVQYVLNFNHQRKIQVISVRGTIDNTNMQLDMDTYGVRDRKAGILIHRGFREASQQIYEDLKPRLNPGYTTYLTGHSLGGAVAAILGIYLTRDNLKLGQIVTFGQPKFTNLTGAKIYRNLPMLRLIYQNDAVAFWPDTFAKSSESYAHIGSVVNLLPGPYYIYGTADQGLRFSVGSLGRLFSQISLPDHKMKWYSQGLKDKLDRAQRINPKNRNKYIVRHKAGTGIETEPPKRKFNFNHHN